MALRVVGLVLLSHFLIGNSVLAEVPGQVSFQGVLVGTDGKPTQGSVDLVFTLYDAVTGGTAVWTESHDAVPVVDGVYDVALGSSVPIDAAILANAPLHLEVTVNGEVLTPRFPLLAVPYAIEAQRARALVGLEGVPPEYYAKVYEFANSDGPDGPLDSDPREGVADVDGDGLPNFLDPDNDGDGYTDVQEVANGTDLNVPDTMPPSIGISPFVAPTRADLGSQFDLVLSVANLQPGFVVEIDGTPVTPSSVSPDQLIVPITGPSTPQDVEIVVRNPDGRSDSLSYPFLALTPSLPLGDIGYKLPEPPTAPPDATTTVTVFMTDLFPPFTIQFGTETPTPTNIQFVNLGTAYGGLVLQLDVEVGPQPIGLTPVTVTNPSGKSFSFDYRFEDPRVIFATQARYTGSQVGGLAGADAKCAAAALAGGLPGTYLAWIADASTDPDTRFDKTRGPFRRGSPNGFVLAEDYADLTDGLIAARINRDEFDNPDPDFNYRWTNVTADGTRLGSDDCSGWTSDAGIGATGFGNGTGADWTNKETRACSEPNRLICVQQ
jgi:hypothetical protein